MSDEHDEKSFFEKYKTVIIAVIVFFILTVVFVIGRAMFSDLFNALEGIVGAGTALVSALSNELKTCTDDGVLSSGCWFGWLGLVGSICVAFVYGAKYFVEYKSNQSIEAERIITNKSLDDITSDFLKEVGGEEGLKELMKEKGIEEKDMKAFTEKLMTQRSSSIVQKSIQKQSLSPDVMKQKILEQKEIYEKESKAIDDRNKISDEKSEEMDKIAKEKFPDIIE